MRVPLEWLKEYVSLSATAEEVATRLTMGGLEVEGIEESAIGPVLDVYVTPNRGDCLSMVGVAREVAALYGLSLQSPVSPKSEPGGDVASQTSVTIDAPDLCPRYAARLVRGLKVGPSPDWMQARLEASGMRPISNVVDVTNYVMLELGQPLHAFDFDKLTGGRIIVRRANPGEVLQTLDGQERTLLPEMLIIADAERAVAVAGVMGGADSEVSETTTNLLLESAHFDPLAVRRASKALGLRTEASYRFERVVDPAICRRAVDRACELLAQMGQAGAVEGVVDVVAKPIAGRDITLRVSRAEMLLGMEITPDVALDCLTRLEIGAQFSPDDGDKILAHIPPRRADLTLEEDLIEEVGRIYGYENIPESLPGGETTRGGDSDEGRLLARIREIFLACGLQEVVSHSLTAPFAFATREDAAERVPVRNALSTDISALRESLIPSLLDVARRNVAHGQRSLALFEIGHVWHNRAGGIYPVETVSVGGLLMGAWQEAGWQSSGKGTPADFYAVRGVVETLLRGLRIENATFAPVHDGNAYPALHPGRAATLTLATGEDRPGFVGEVHPLAQSAAELRDRAYVFEIGLDALRHVLPADLEQGPRFASLARFPAVSRDLSPRVVEATLYADVESAIDAANVPMLESYRLVDVFRGGPVPDGMKSVTVGFTFRSPEGTLQEAQITQAMSALRAELEARCGAQFVG